MERYLISGIKGGLGKYLYDNLPNSIGFGRDEFNLIKNKDFDTIIHCAFNKEQHEIKDYYSYLEDNIFLTQDLLKLPYKKFIYISTIDVYQKHPNYYSLFKRFSESIVDKNLNTLNLRCSMMLGPTMKPNHATKLYNNNESIGLSPNSEFNYILMEDILKFISSRKYYSYKKPIDFISNNSLKLKELKNIFNSDTKLGNYTYEMNLDFTNPIYMLDPDFNKSSKTNIKTYFK